MHPVPRPGVLADDRLFPTDLQSSSHETQSSSSKVILGPAIRVANGYGVRSRDLGIAIYQIKLLQIVLLVRSSVCVYVYCLAFV